VLCFKDYFTGLTVKFRVKYSTNITRIKAVYFLTT